MGRKFLLALIVGGKGERIWGAVGFPYPLTFVVLFGILLSDKNQFCGIRRMGEARYARSTTAVRCAERQQGG